MKLRWYSVYDALTGEIIGSFTAASDTVAANVPAGRLCIEGAFDTLTGYVQDGHFVPYTPEQAAAKAARPRPGMCWDNTAMGWLDPRPPEQVHAQAWTEVRTKRDKLLAQCDWVVLRATEQGEPVPSAWLSYRQALRDITQQADPNAIEWPAIPTGT